MSSSKSEKASGLKRGKKAGQDKGQGQQIVDVIDESHREFYVIQIRDLEERIARLQSECDVMEVKNSALKEKLTKNSDDQHDIVEYVEKKLKEKENEVDRIQTDVDSAERCIGEERRRFESHHAQILEEFHATKEQLQHESSTLATKLASLDDLRCQREELEKRISTVEDALRKQAEEHKEKKYLLEKQHIMNKDRLKREMQEQIESMSRKFRESSNDQLLGTTQKAIETNLVQSNKLDEISNLSTNRIAENRNLAKQVLETRLKKEILEENAERLNKKYDYYTQKLKRYKKEIEQLREEQLREDFTSASDSLSTSASSSRNDTQERLKLPSLRGSSVSLCSSN